MSQVEKQERTGKITIPKTGTKLEIFLGYKENTLIRMGLFVVDEVGVENPLKSMLVRARAADMRQVLKTLHTKTWGVVTLSDIVSMIVGEHGLNARISDALANIAYPQDEFEEMLNRAAEEDAKRALHDVGLDGENAAEDIWELRSLLSTLQFTRRIALQTFVKVITTAILVALLTGLALKLKILTITGVK